MPFVRYCGKIWYSQTGHRIRRLCVAVWIPKATDAHLEYVMRIAFNATVATRTRQSVTVCVQCVSCSCILCIQYLNAMPIEDVTGRSSVCYVIESGGRVLD
jgi:hypothetical protein